LDKTNTLNKKLYIYNKITITMVHNYVITELEREISGGVVNKICFMVDSLHEEVGERYNGEIEITGSIGAAGFIEFESLTKENVLSWITSIVDTASIEQENSSSIAGMISATPPSTTTEGLPWDE